MSERYDAERRAEFERARARVPIIQGIGDVPLIGDLTAEVGAGILTGVGFDPDQQRRFSPRPAPAQVTDPATPTQIQNFHTTIRNQYNGRESPHWADIEPRIGLD